MPLSTTALALGTLHDLHNKVRTGGPTRFGTQTWQPLRGGSSVALLVPPLKKFGKKLESLYELENAAPLHNGCRVGGRLIGGRVDET